MSLYFRIHGISVCAAFCIMLLNHAVCAAGNDGIPDAVLSALRRFDNSMDGQVTGSVTVKRSPVVQDQIGDQLRAQVEGMGMRLSSSTLQRKDIIVSGTWVTRDSKLQYLDTVMHECLWSETTGQPCRLSAATPTVCWLSGTHYLIWRKVNRQEHITSCAVTGDVARALWGFPDLVSAFRRASSQDETLTDELQRRGHVPKGAPPGSYRTRWAETRESTATTYALYVEGGPVSRLAVEIALDNDGWLTAYRAYQPTQDSPRTGKQCCKFEKIVAYSAGNGSRKPARVINIERGACSQGSTQEPAVTQEVAIEDIGPVAVDLSTTPAVFLAGRNQ